MLSLPSTSTAQHCQWHVWRFDSNVHTLVFVCLCLGKEMETTSVHLKRSIGLVSICRPSCARVYSREESYLVLGLFQRKARESTGLYSPLSTKTFDASSFHQGKYRWTWKRKNGSEREWNGERDIVVFTSHHIASHHIYFLFIFL